MSIAPEPSVESGTNFRGAFEVQGTPILGQAMGTPEPATLAPTLIGALAPAGHGWRRSAHRGG
jgi:hypothetical protein